METGTKTERRPMSLPIVRQVTHPIVDSDMRFPVRRVYCVGRNYDAHSIEMGGDPKKDPPFFFMKPADTLVPPGGEFPYPPASSDVHHEVEFVIAIGSKGTDVSLEDALNHVWGYAVGIDMTRRDLQAAAKKAGRPWSTAKGFDHSAPMSALVPVSKCGHPSAGAITLTVNGEDRQTGDLTQMVWDTANIVSYLSGLFTIRPGDLIFTGTPSGVGPVQQGDVMEASIAGLPTIRVPVV
jgi:fumarylpyruvate hydrolase